MTRARCEPHVCAPACVVLLCTLYTHAHARITHDGVLAFLLYRVSLYVSRPSTRSRVTAHAPAAGPAAVLSVPVFHARLGLRVAVRAEPEGEARGHVWLFTGHELLDTLRSARRGRGRARAAAGRRPASHTDLSLSLSLK